MLSWFVDIFDAPDGRIKNVSGAALLVTKAASCTSGNSGRLQRTRNPAVRNATPATWFYRSLNRKPCFINQKYNR